MILNFRPKNVDAFERANECSIGDKLTPEIRNLVGLIRLGSDNCSEDRAYEILEAELDSGKDIMDLMFDIMGFLQLKGLLPRKMPIAKMREQVENEMETMIAQNLNLSNVVRDGETSGEL